MTPDPLPPAVTPPRAAPLSDSAVTALRERAKLSEERFDLAVTACGLGFWDIDLLAGSVYFSPGLKQLLGYADEELANAPDTLPALMHPDDRERVLALADRVIAGPGEEPVAEFRLRHKGGRWVWVHSRGVAVRDGAGRAVRLAGTHTDVTARVEAEAAVRTSEERLRTLLKSARDVVSVLAPDGTRLFVSGGSVRLAGYRPPDLVGTSVFDNIHPDDRAAVRATLAVITAAPHAEGRVEFRYKVADGRYVHLEAAGVNLCEEPAVGGVLVSARDITERRRLEAQLRQGQKLEALGQLAGGVAHDFNNLLTVILGNLDLLDPPSAADRKLLAQVRAAGDRARGLVASLLRFARRDEPAAPQPTDLVKLLGATAEVLRRTFDKRVTVAVDLPAGLPAALADPGAVEQAVVNLAFNARDAMPAGGTLTVSAEFVEVTHPLPHPDARPGRFVAVSVSDTGAGMPAEVRARAFEPFFTTKGDGTGLGLAMVADTARRLGGWTTAESEPGRGSRVGLVLPAADPAGRALVIDDEELVRTVAVAVLQRAGWEVDEAADGSAGLAAYRRRRPDVVLLDLSLPGQPGEDVLAELLAFDPAARVVVASGLLPDEPPAGAAGALAKPFTPAQLLAAVRAAR